MIVLHAVVWFHAGGFMFLVFVIEMDIEDFFVFKFVRLDSKWARKNAIPSTGGEAVADVCFSSSDACK